MVRLLLRLTGVALVGVGLAAAYIALPFYTAWSIREAIRDNDSAYLERKIEWASVRATLKESLGTYMAATSGDAVPVAEQPSLWQQVKSYFGRGAVAQFVDATITPTGMSSLFSMRKAYHATVGGEPEVRPPLLERMRRVWSKVTRAEFAAFTRFEMDMIDKNAPERTINCVLELRGTEWKMTELRVKPTAAVNRVADGQRQLTRIADLPVLPRVPG